MSNTGSIGPAGLSDAERARFYAYSAAAVAAALATAVFAVLLLMPAGSAGESGSSGDATGFIFFEEIHSTIFVKPGFTGVNDVELVIGRHDGTTPEIAEAGATVRNVLDGTTLGPFEAEPVSGRPGTFSISSVDFPTAGDWEFDLTIREADAEAVRGTTVVSIGDRATTG